jgi:hypothetical protein
MRCDGSGETCPLTDIGVLETDVAENRKSLLFGGTGTYDLEEFSSRLEAESVIFQCILYAKA